MKRSFVIISIKKIAIVLVCKKHDSVQIFLTKFVVNFRTIAVGHSWSEGF
jgi:hypothetical protein